VRGSFFALVKPTTLATAFRIYMSSQQANYIGHFANIATTGLLWFSFGNNSSDGVTGRYSVTGSTVMVADTWYAVGGSWDNLTVGRLYVNGAPEIVTYSGTAATYVRGITGAARIGGWFVGSTYSYATGQIAALMVWHDALPEAAFLQLAANAFAGWRPSQQWWYAAVGGAGLLRELYSGYAQQAALAAQERASGYGQRLDAGTREVATGYPQWLTMAREGAFGYSQLDAVAVQALQAGFAQWGALDVDQLAGGFAQALALEAEAVAGGYSQRLALADREATTGYAQQLAMLAQLFAGYSQELPPGYFVSELFAGYSQRTALATREATGGFAQRTLLADIAELDTGFAQWLHELTVLTAGFAQDREGGGVYPIPATFIGTALPPRFGGTALPPRFKSGR
jgi:hypothetical protein